MMHRDKSVKVSGSGRVSAELGLGRVFVLSLNNHRDTRHKYDDTSFLQVRKLRLRKFE